MKPALYNNRPYGRDAKLSADQPATTNRHKCAIMLSCSVLALTATGAVANTINLRGQGTVTTTNNDIYVDNTGPSSIICGEACGGSGGFVLKPNTTGNNDAISIQNALINVTHLYQREGRAIDIGPTDSYPAYNATGSYTVVMQGSDIKANSTSTAFCEHTAVGSIVLDTTGGSANTVHGGIGYSVGGTNDYDVSVAMKIGPDTIVAQDNPWSTYGLYAIPTGKGSVSIDTTNTNIYSMGGEGSAGIFVYGARGNVTLGGMNGGLSGLINTPSGYGISISNWGNTIASVTLGQNGKIDSKGGVNFRYGHIAIVDSYGTILAGVDAAVSGSVDSETVTLRSGSKTVGVVQGSEDAGSTSTLNIYAGADISGARFVGVSGTTTVHLKGDGSANFNGAQTLGISTVQKDDSGTWNLLNSGGGHNTYVVTAGTLTITSDNNTGVPNNTFVLKNGGTLGFRASGYYWDTAQVEGHPLFNTMGANISFGGKISDGSIPGYVEITGGGTLILANATNSYSGGTVVKDGSTLLIDNDHQLGASTSGVTLGDATTSGRLTLSGSFDLATSRPISLGAGGGEIYTWNASTISQTISGTGSLTKSGNGTLTLTGTNTYAGDTIIAQGTLAVSSDAGLGHAGGTVILGASGWSGSLVLNSSFDIARNMVLAQPNDSFITTTGTNTLSGTISGAGALHTLGSGVLILTGANTYTGGTIINGGVLVASADNNLGASSGMVHIAGSTLRWASSFDTARNIYIGINSGIIDTKGYNSTLSGTIYGTNMKTATLLTKKGTGTPDPDGLVRNDRDIHLRRYDAYF